MEADANGLCGTRERTVSFNAFDLRLLRLRAGVGLGFAGTVDISRSLACAKFTWKEQQTVGIFPTKVDTILCILNAVEEKWGQYIIILSIIIHTYIKWSVIPSELDKKPKHSLFNKQQDMNICKSKCRLEVLASPMKASTSERSMENFSWVQYSKDLTPEDLHTNLHKWLAVACCSYNQNSRNTN